MRKLIAISFLIILLTSSNSFGQILRLPTLVHHYFEHVEWDNSTLSEFLSIHYAVNINHPDDKHHDHENLPFKTVDSHTSIIDNIFLQTNYSIIKVIVETSDIKISSSYYQNYSNSYLNNIWQPPRFS